MQWLQHFYSLNIHSSSLDLIPLWLLLPPSQDTEREDNGGAKQHDKIRIVHDPQKETV